MVLHLFTVVIPSLVNLMQWAVRSPSGLIWSNCLLSVTAVTNWHHTQWRQSPGAGLHHCSKQWLYKQKHLVPVKCLKQYFEFSCFLSLQKKKKTKTNPSNRTTHTSKSRTDGQLCDSWLTNLSVYLIFPMRVNVSCVKENHSIPLTHP